MLFGDFIECPRVLVYPRWPWYDRNLWMIQIPRVFGVICLQHDLSRSCVLLVTCWARDCLWEIVTWKCEVCLSWYFWPHYIDLLPTNLFFFSFFRDASPLYATGILIRSFSTPIPGFSQKWFDQQLRGCICVVGGWTGEVCQVYNQVLMLSKCLLWWCSSDIYSTCCFPAWEELLNNIFQPLFEVALDPVGRPSGKLAKI